jgi:hypothetical protein
MASGWIDSRMTDFIAYSLKYPLTVTSALCYLAAPGYVVSGKGNPESLDSASHGAGRAMSRKAANENFNWKDVNRFLKQQGVTLISAGLDEAPMAYKNIRRRDGSAARSR